jgi:hypothetical protein
MAHKKPDIAFDCETLPPALMGSQSVRVPEDVRAKDVLDRSLSKAHREGMSMARCGLVTQI